MKRSELKRKTPLKANKPLERKSALKSTRKSSNPVPTGNDTCICCGRPFAHTHEVFFGTANRELSIRYGLQVRLCQDCHEGTNGVHGKNGHALDLKLKREAQAKFEQTHTRTEFIALFGRNYIEAETSERRTA